MHRRDFLSCVAAMSILPTERLNAVIDQGETDEVKRNRLLCALSAAANAVRMEVLEILHLWLANNNPDALRQALSDCKKFTHNKSTSASFVAECMRYAPGIFSLIGLGELMPILSGWMMQEILMLYAKMLRRKYEEILREMDDDASLEK